MTAPRMTFGRALLFALANPSGYIAAAAAAETTTKTFMVADAPDMPITAASTAMTFRPEWVTVTRMNGRFRHMEISGPTAVHERFNTIRRFDREKDVPEWARKYLGEDN